MAEPGVHVARRGAAPALQGAPVALLVVDDDIRVAEASIAACRLLGVSRDDAIGRPLPELLSPAAAERLRGVWGAFHVEGGHAGPFELPWPSRGGSVDIRVTPSVLPGRHLVVLDRAETAPPERANGSDPVPRSAEGTRRAPTARERQILAMLAAGDTDIQIATKLELSPATVQTHVRNAKAKLGARTRAQAVAIALRGDLIQA